MARRRTGSLCRLAPSSQSRRATLGDVDDAKWFRWIRWGRDLYHHLASPAAIFRRLSDRDSTRPVLVYMPPTPQRALTTVRPTPQHAGGSSLFAVIRHYHFDKKDSAEIDRLVREQFVPIIRKANGFVRYYWLDTGNGEGASFGVFNNKAGADEPPENHSFAHAGSGKTSVRQLLNLLSAQINPHISHCQIHQCHVGAFH